MDTQQMLGVLLNTTEQQSQTTDKLLAALQAQIDALSEATRSAQRAAAAVELAARNAAPVIQKTVAEAEAVRVSVLSALAGISETAVTAMHSASRPLLDKLSSLATAVTQAEGKLKAATASFGWKWMLIAIGTLVATLAAFGLGAWLMVAWQRHQVDTLIAERAQLQGEVVQLQANANAWVKRGGRAKLGRCGDRRRLCARIEKGQAYGKDNDYFVLRGD